MLPLRSFGTGIFAAALAGCGTFGLEAPPLEDGPPFGGDTRIEPDSGDPLPDDTGTTDDTEEPPQDDPPEISGLSVTERTADQVLRVTFEGHDPDGDLDGGQARLTVDGVTTTYRIPNELDLWVPQGESRVDVSAAGMDPGQTVGVSLVLVDAGGHASAPATTTVGLAGCTENLPENGDDVANVTALGRLDLPARVFGNVYRTGNNGSTYTGDVDWFSFTAASSDRVTLSLAWTAAAGDYDIFVYEGTRPVGVSAEEGTVQPEVVTLSTTSGTTYSVAVGGWSGPTGDYTVDIR